MSRHVHIDRKEVLELKNQGYSITAIAKRYGCCRDKIYKVIKGKTRAPERTLICPYCQSEYKVSGKSQKKTCGAKECVKKQNRINNRILYEKRKQKKQQARLEGKVRPYTETSNMLIVQDLEEGRSIKFMAAIYDRDPEDLKKHIERIIQDGTARKIKQMLDLHQKCSWKRRSMS